jgi:hypothetical protein
MSAELDKKRAKGRGNRNTIEGQYLGSMPVYDATTTPTDPEAYWSEWSNIANWFNYKFSPKDFKTYAVRYAKEYLKLSKDDLKDLKKVKDGRFLPVSKLTAIHFTGFNYRDTERSMIDIHLKDLIKQGKLIVDEVVEDEDKPKVVSIQSRMFSKMMETIYNEFDDTIIEGWFARDFSAKFDAFTSIKRHDVKGASIKMFANKVSSIRSELNDAYAKDCEDSMEAYSNWTRPHLKKAIKQLDEILADVEAAQLANKAVRKPRASKPKASDKQVAKLNYLKEDNDSKLASISPIQIPGAKVLYIYNVKQKRLTEFVTDNDVGFIVQGSSLKNFDDKLSRVCALRKPSDILPQILKKTQKQIDNVFNGLTTKVSVPAGRINKDCIILRVIN